MTTSEILKTTAATKREIAALSEQKINAALMAIADGLNEDAEEILAANAQDMQAAQGQISEVMRDRLALSAARIAAMAEGVRQVAALKSPLGEILSETTRADGLNIKKISVPLGMVAIIYESRPNVTVDAAALALKSGNACILRAGKEAHRSAAALVKSMRRALSSLSITPSAIGFIEDTSRESAKEIMTAKGLVDLLIPRGGAGLIKACVENAKVPCIETGTGICHVYVDGAADLNMALKIIENAKCSRPSVCNAMEVCLVDGAVAAEFLTALYKKLCVERKVNPVTFVLDKKAGEILNGTNCIAAQEDDFDTEFLDYKMAVAVVDGVEGAIEHIRAHSTGHSDCIITEDNNISERFVSSIDSAAVYVNASTRFTDGGEFGLGCEMGISTQKLHARGPMGLRELTTYKYVVTGKGNIR